MDELGLEVVKSIEAPEPMYGVSPMAKVYKDLSRLRSFMEFTEEVLGVELLESQKRVVEEVVSSGRVVENLSSGWVVAHMIPEPDLDTEDNTTMNHYKGR